MEGFVTVPPRMATLAVADIRSQFPAGPAFCIGRNCRWSADEPAPQEMPVRFMKPSTAVVQAAGFIPFPPSTVHFRHEIELVVAIGQGGRDVDPAPATSQRTWGHAAGLGKHAVTGLTKALALDGRASDIVAGQIDVGNALTDLAERMTRGVLQADGGVAPEPTMDGRHVADAVRPIAAMPLHVDVLTMTVMASAMPFVGRS